MSVNHTRSSDSVSLERAASSQTSRHANSGSPQPVTGPPQSAVDHLNQFSIGIPISASAQPSPREPTSPADEDVEDAPSAMSVDITSQRGSKWTASGITFNAAIAIGLQSSLEELVLVMRQAIVDAGLNAGLNELLDGPRIRFNTILSMRGRDVHPAITLDLASGGLHNGLAIPKCHDSGADQVDGWVIYHGTKDPAGILRSRGVLHVGKRTKKKCNGWSAARDLFMATKYGGGFHGFRCVVELLAKCVVRSRGTSWHYVPHNCLRYAVQAFHFLAEQDCVGIERL